MIVEQQVLQSPGDLPTPAPRVGDRDRLVLVFGPRERVSDRAELERITSAFPGAKIIGCSTAGQIVRSAIPDHALTLTSLTFDSTRIRTRRVAVEDVSRSKEAGFALGRLLESPDLRYVLVLSGALRVNGSDLVNGLLLGLGRNFPFSGGLAADDTRFQKTVVLDNDGCYEGFAVAVGFYGNALKVKTAVSGGWSPISEPHVVTRSKGGVVFEMDGEPALDVYGCYLGTELRNLPASGLRYPFGIQTAPEEIGPIRAVIALDRERRGLTFGGNMPQGAQVRLMTTDREQLLAGVRAAGRQTRPDDGPPAELAILVSSVGHKLLLDAEAPREIQAVAEELPTCPTFTGFYAYGEIGAFEGTHKCELHNQSMTVTTIQEAGNTP